MTVSLGWAPVQCIIVLEFHAREAWDLWTEGFPFDGVCKTPPRVVRTGVRVPFFGFGVGFDVDTVSPEWSPAPGLGRECR